MANKLTEYIQRKYDEGMHPDAAIEAGEKKFGKNSPLWKTWGGIHMTNIAVDVTTGKLWDLHRGIEFGPGAKRKDRK